VAVSPTPVDIENHHNSAFKIYQEQQTFAPILALDSKLMPGLSFGRTLRMTVEMICLPDHMTLGLIIAGGSNLIFPGMEDSPCSTNWWYSARLKNRPRSDSLTPDIT